jgi:hypothetical protein
MKSILAGKIPGSGSADPKTDIASRYVAAIRTIAREHEATRSPFFRRFAELPHEVATDPDLLGQIHLVYQSAMHATRAAVYYMPHLDNPEMRKRKLAIFVDDDGLPGGDTHHYQLTRAFQRMGAHCVLTDEEFGGATELCRHLDPETANFVQLASRLYARSLGPWCAVEMMSDTWMRALMNALAVHFPDVVNEPYFAECFDNHVEERHADESLDVTCTVLRQQPYLYSETVLDAKLMAEALVGVWTRLDAIVLAAELQRRGQPPVVVPRRVAKLVREAV